jgi:cation diffusion facilitator family transporter
VTTSEISDDNGTRRNVLLSLGVNGVETLALGLAAWMTGSVGLRAQTAANAADLAVVAFLLIGVLSSARPADDSHPLGYGRERFFWSLFAALGIFVGGAGLALAGAVESGLHPSPVDHYAIAYFVLATTVSLDAFALVVAMKPMRLEAATRDISLRAQARRSTDPAALTVVIGGACAVIGAVVAAAGLVTSQLTGSAAPDTVASAFIGLVLLVASIILLRANRALLSGRGVPIYMLREMNRVVAARPGIVAVPDLFAVVVGPSSLIVDGDVIFSDELTVPDVEQAIIGAAAALRARWPSVDYVYLTPVPKARSRRAARAARTRVAAAGHASVAELPVGAEPMKGRNDSSTRGEHTACASGHVARKTDPKAVVWLASRPQDGDNSMADLVDLVVIGYPDEATAEKAYEVVLGLEHDLVMQVAGAAVVVKHADGKAKMITKTGATRAGAMMGGFFGLLFGLLFLIPVGGLIFGGIMGAVMGTLTGWGIKDDFRQRVQDVLKPGSAALVLFIKKWTEDKALAALAPLGGEVLKTSLSDEATKEINDALETN